MSPSGLIMDQSSHSAGVVLVSPRTAGPVRVDAAANSQRKPRALAYRNYLKPALDRVIAGLLLLLLLPALLMCGLAVRLSLGRGVFYRQPRVGRDARVFTLYKFRTMRFDERRVPLVGYGPRPRSAQKPLFDARVTRVGRLLRRTSLDELPQLWNVLRGEMSLVGPRPELVSLVEHHRLWRHPRHLMRPGLTGPWQISPFRNSAIAEHLEFDDDYLVSCSLRTDLRILSRTVMTVIRPTGR